MLPDHTIMPAILPEPPVVGAEKLSMPVPAGAAPVPFGATPAL
jgi:hypothetical protein